MSSTLRRTPLVSMAIALVCFVLLSATRVAMTQPAGLTPETVAAQGVLQPTLRFDTISGMPSSALVAFAQDSRGFLWFGTEYGLGRYDGYQFRNFEEMEGLTISALLDAGDSLWIATNDAGLRRFDYATETFSTVALASESTTSLSATPDGRVWVGTSDVGVIAVDPKTNDQVNFGHDRNDPGSLISNEITALLTTPDGIVWAGTAQSGLAQIDSRTNSVMPYYEKFDSGLAGDTVTTLFADSQGQIWIGSDAGASRFDRKNETFTRYLASENGAKRINAITEAHDGSFWLGTTGSGIYSLDVKTGTLKNYNADPNDSSSVYNPFVRAAFTDRNGVLWFGFNSGKASKLYLLRRNFSFYKSHPGFAFLERGNSVWLGSRNVGLRRMHLDSGRVTEFMREQLVEFWQSSLASDKSGAIWIGTIGNGLFRFDPKTETFEHYNQEEGYLPDDGVYALHATPEDLWIGTRDGLVRHKLGSNIFENVFVHNEDNDNTLSSEFVRTIKKDINSNQLWVGTAKGLNRIDLDKRSVQRFLPNPDQQNSISHEFVTDIYQQGATLWVATWGGGLNKLDIRSGSFETFNKNNGLSSNTVYGILDDQKGNLWLTTNDKLTRFTPKTSKTVVFGQSDGLSRDELASGGFHRGTSGRFYVGSPEGFNIFEPDSIEMTETAPSLAFTNFQIGGKPLAVPKEVHLSYRDAVFSLEFSALSFADSSRNRYRYRLKGIHDWIETTSRLVPYSRLPAGSYQFEVQGANHHGSWSEETLTLPVNVAPPPWQTWWAYTLYVLLIATAIALFVRRNRKKLRDLEQSHRLSALEREIELTSVVQEGFLPRTPGFREGPLHLQGFYRPAAQCSGDWWWYEKRAGGYFIVVGDVTGHGAGPAMVTAAVAASFRTMGDKVPDEHRIREVNEEVLRVSDGKYTMTMTAMDLDPRTGRYKLYFAGGMPAFSLDRSASGGHPRTYMSRGTPLGTKQLHIGTVDGNLVPGERILLLTDGVPEIAIRGEKLLGMRRLYNVYSETVSSPVDTAVAQIVAYAEQSLVGPQDDDWTMVMLEWTP